MDNLGKLLFKRVTGKSFEEATRIKTGEQVVRDYLQQTGSNYPLRPLGWASDGAALLSEEARESHIHILGAPGEGKSKFIELLIRQDIDRGYGCCLLDPNRGDTVYSVLKYCIKKGVEKVLLIDPHDVFVSGKICTLNPFGRTEYLEGKPKRYTTRTNEAVGNTMDTMRILWGDKGHEGIARISKYLPAVLKALHQSNSTLHDAVYFTDQGHPAYRARRNQILDSLHELDTSRVALESVFANSRSIFNMEFDSTIRRINPLLEDTMKLMLGSNNTPVNFMKMVSEGWVILVNLDPGRVWGSEQERFLGTLVINEIIFAVSRLIDSGWQGVYYVYVDEAGKYATPKLAEILDYKRHIGVRFTLAHQRFAQFEDAEVQSAVKGSTKIKVLFNTPSRQDRDEMIRMMYGGDIPDRQVSYQLAQLQKQHAAVKINKQPPRIVRFKDLPEIKVAPQVLADFKARIYANEWYSTREEILTEINARFRPKELPRQPGGFVGEAGRNLKGARSRKATDRKAVSKPAPAGQEGKPRETYFDKKIRKDP